MRCEEKRCADRQTITKLTGYTRSTSGRNLAGGPCCETESNPRVVPRQVQTDADVICVSSSELRCSRMGKYKGG